MDIIIIIILLLIVLGFRRSPKIITGGGQYSIIFISAITQDMANKSAKRILKILGSNWKLLKNTNDINSAIRSVVTTSNIIVASNNLSHSIIDSDIRPDIHIHVSPMPHTTPEELMANKSVIMASLVSGGGKNSKSADTLWDEYVDTLGKSSINSIIQHNNYNDIKQICETYKFIKA